MKNNMLTIIAGPCSVDQENIEDLYQIATLNDTAPVSIAGVRVVGVKSRTAYQTDGSGMGIDVAAIEKNAEILRRGGSVADFLPLPSVQIAKRFVQDTGLLVATEIVNPTLQLPSYAQVEDFRDKLLIWNPAVNQLGWLLHELGRYANEYGWQVGIKNGKWVGEDVSVAEAGEKEIPLEKVWSGLVSYTGLSSERMTLIHRGVDVPGKGNYRNVPVHGLAGRVKQATGARLLFDPSHVYGPKMRGSIVEETVKAMAMKLSEEEFLYDGMLIEVGRSKTDTEQHITVAELRELVERVGEFRGL